MKTETFHTMSVIIINLVLMIITFSTDNPLIIVTLLLWSIIALVIYKDTKKLSLGLKIFFPLAIITTLINILFVKAGSRVLITILGKQITLETFLYAIFMSMKILVILYLFYVLSNMLNSDKALSYFSKKSPKITLIVLLSLKLVPNMTKRMNTLKEVYLTRGVDLESTSKKERIKANIPVLSVLLEDSLEGAFDIGESAYVRGFLSGKRSEYEKSTLKLKDFLLIIYFSILLVMHITFTLGNKISFDVYDGSELLTFINRYSILESGLVIITLVFLIKDYVQRRREKENELYRN